METASCSQWLTVIVPQLERAPPLVHVRRQERQHGLHRRVQKGRLGGDTRGLARAGEGRSPRRQAGRGCHSASRPRGTGPHRDRFATRQMYGSGRSLDLSLGLSRTVAAILDDSMLPALCHLDPRPRACSVGRPEEGRPPPPPAKSRVSDSVFQILQSRPRVLGVDKSTTYRTLLTHSAAPRPP
jgi:hypothetical protein